MAKTGSACSNPKTFHTQEMIHYFFAMKHQIPSSPQKTLVSIVIPSFNQGIFIDETVRSVLAQTYRPLEIIIIDAASTDNTLEILRKFDGVPEIRWYSEADRGHADGLNKGFNLASGEIVAWLNSDDVYFSRESISRAVAVLSKHPSIDVLYGDVAIISDNNILLRYFFVPPYDKKRILRQNFIPQPTVFIKKTVTESEKLDISQIGLDYEYWLRLITKGYRFHHINALIACDRHYQNRISVVKKNIIDEQIFIAKNKLGINTNRNTIAYFLDRFLQAICRLRGFISLCYLPVFLKKDSLAFNLRIDSYKSLLWRQLTKPIGSNFNNTK
jgi:glycosyltransferase involved in cell wall biosynthesis